MRVGRSILPLLCCLIACATFRSAQAGNFQPPKLKISGYGFLGNRQLTKLLESLQPAGGKSEFYDANFIEDSALLLISNVQRDGYLEPRITAQVTLDNGDTELFEWREAQREPLPRPLRARKVYFKIQRGVLYHYVSVQFQDLKKITEKEARSFFIETGVLVPLKNTRVYTPGKLSRGVASLKETLQRRGFESAAVEVIQLKQDDRNGRVAVRIKVEEGPKSIVHSIRRDLYVETADHLEDSNVISTNAVYSTLWVQDLKESLKSVWLHQGYADVAVDISPISQKPDRDTIHIDLLAKVITGPRVSLGKVRFEGYKKTRLSLLDRRVRLFPGEELDRVKVEEGRSRLARLGIFDSVELDYGPVSEHERDVIYRVKEGKRIDVSLLAGYGSYELLRGGVEVEQFNVFGLAHHARLRLIQSFKSSSGDYTYTMPELLGRDVDLFFTASGLRRQEISFTREEYGGGLGVRKYYKPIFSDISVRYQYQVLNAADTLPGIANVGLTNATVGALITEFRHDRRDNPLYPHHGYKVFSNLELGARVLGGNANYQRFEAAASYHFPLYDSGWMNLGLSHGVILTIGARSQDLPFNRRFFPGGENSIRGYQEGEASPRDSTGQLIGAETYLLGNVEFEQALTRAFSLVLFSDSIGFARDLNDYPVSESLYSVGGGLRWKTIVGPIRLEYGHNLNARPGDPSGTIHFSMGFPF